MHLLAPHRGFHGQGLYEVVFSFAPNGAGIPDASLNRSGAGTGARAGFTATYAGSAGLYNVDSTEPFAELVHADAGLVLGGGAQVDVATPLGTSLANQGRRVQVQAYNAAGAATDLAAASNRRITLHLVMHMSKGA